MAKQFIGQADGEEGEGADAAPGQQTDADALADAMPFASTPTTASAPDQASTPDDAAADDMAANDDAGGAAESSENEDDAALDIERFKLNYDPEIFETLKAQYSDTVYPAMAYLEVARVDIENGDLDKAVDKLTWVARTTTHDALRYVADLRRARVLIAMARADEALDILSTTEFPPELARLTQEVRGDALAKQGDKEAAAAAYRKAIEASARPTDFLQMKLDDLGLDSE